MAPRTARSRSSWSARPQLILLDLMMPVLDGWGFLQACRLERLCDNIPIIIMSAGKRAAEVEELQADAFLPKPFDLDEMLAVVERDPAFDGRVREDRIPESCSQLGRDEYACSFSASCWVIGQTGKRIGSMLAKSRRDEPSMRSGVPTSTSPLARSTMELERRGTASEARWDGQMDPSRHHITQAVEGKGRFVGDGATVVGPDPHTQEIVQP
jgi:CheY-like chemotaxis protein